jgi:hypothetical protein
MSMLIVILLLAQVRYLQSQASIPILEFWKGDKDMFPFRFVVRQNEPKPRNQSDQDNL